MQNKKVMKHSILIFLSAAWFQQFVFIPSYGQWTETIIDENISHAIAVDVADLDGDSKSDLIVTDFTNGKLLWYQNKYPDWIKSTIDNYRATFAYSGDMDGDDTLDVVATRYHEKELVWYENDQLTWTKHIIDDSTTMFYDYLTVADLNKDENPDVVTAVTSGIYNKIGDIAWYENDHPTWIKHIIDTVSNGTPTVTVADIDGDEIPDVVATMDIDNEIVWFKTQDSGLTWSKHFIDSSFVGAWNMDFYDINRDSSLDVVATSRSGDNLVWYENHHPIWIKHIIDASLDGADVPFFSDVDGDDTMDVVVSGYFGDEVVWYENNHPEWTKHLIVENLDGANVIAVADLDDDGIKEVVVPASKSLTLYKNPLSAVYIPDTAFRYALIEEGVDTNNDSLISYAEAEAVTYLYVTEKGISSMTGIEAFINLDSLWCRWNQLTSLDMSGNTKLIALDCGYNELSSLIVSGNSKLEYLGCERNLLTSLDISNNKHLWWLMCGGPRGELNMLTELDLSGNIELEVLVCANNFLSSLDVSNNPGLRVLLCHNNQLTTINVNNNPFLEELICWGNQLSGLDLSNNPNLTGLTCGNNPMERLDIRNNPGIKSLRLWEMPFLTCVTVWELPFPPEGVNLETVNTPNINFTLECPDIESPLLTAPDNIFQPDSIEATSSEDGIIYLVQPDTEKEIVTIRKASIDSVAAVSNKPVNIPLSGLANGTYWLYARDSSDNISDPEAFTITGVGMEYLTSGTFSIYPNPTFDLIIIQTNGEWEYSIKLFNMSGQIIHCSKFVEGSHSIDLSYLQKGIYVITIRSKDFAARKKIIKL